MFFKKQFFLFLGFVFLLSCALEIGEEAPPIPKYRLILDSSYCSNLNYEEEFKSYFLDIEEKHFELPRGERLKRALNCLELVISRNKKVFKNKEFGKQELINLLNQDFIKTDNMEPIINHVTQPSHFENYIFFKNNIVYMIEKDKKNQAVLGEKMCQAKGTNKIVFSKKDVDVFLIFLENLASFFLKIEKASSDVFKNFFQKNLSDPYLFSKNKLGRSLTFRNQFLLFLSEYMREDFPEYSQFLDNYFFEIDYDFSQFKDRYGLSRWKRNRLKKLFHIRNEIITPLLIMTQWPLSESDELNAQNIKYILLNIYIMKTFFNIYDTDGDSQLSSEELEPLSCLMTLLVSMIISPRLKDQWEIVKEIYDPQAVSGYILSYQKIPSRYDFDFLRYRLFENKNLKSLSYIEVSRLISTLFTTFFDKGFKEFVEES